MTVDSSLAHVLQTPLKVAHQLPGIQRIQVLKQMK